MITDQMVEAALSRFNDHNAHREPWQMTHGHELDAMRAALEAAEAAAWQPIETAPMDGEVEVLVTDGVEVWKSALQLTNDIPAQLEWSKENKWFQEPAYWRPLPAAPYWRPLPAAPKGEK